MGARGRGWWFGSSHMLAELHVGISQEPMHAQYFILQWMSLGISVVIIFVTLGHMTLKTDFIAWTGMY